MDLFGADAIQLGPLALSRSLLVSFGITIVLGLLAYLSTRRLSLQPTAWQVVLEGIVGAIDNAVGEVLPDYGQRVMPFIATLWIFLVVANLSGLFPGLETPTGDLSITAALALLVFLSVHGYGIGISGLRGYLRHYVQPNPLLLPFHLVSEVTRTVALAVRLFGNMMSLDMAALLILVVAGFLAPVPILMLHIVEALVQAYIFGMLALIYVAGAIQVQQRHVQQRHVQQRHAQKRHTQKRKKLAKQE